MGFEGCLDFLELSSLCWSSRQRARISGENAQRWGGLGAGPCWSGPG